MGNAEKYEGTAAELLALADRASDPRLSSVYATLSLAYQRLAVCVGNREQADPTQSRGQRIRRLPERASPASDSRH